MAETPESCPTCGIAVPPGAARCPGCGRVFGEQNRCPHCHAVAAVIERRGKTVCAACGKPRVGAVTLSGDRPSRRGIVRTTHQDRQTGTRAMLARARGRSQRGLGIVALAAGIAMAAAAAVLIPGALGLVVALVAGALGVGLGGLSVRAGARNMEAARALEGQADDSAILELAKQRGGVLTADETAEALGLGVEEADALLTSMVGDGSEVDVEVDAEGRVTYEFHALRQAAAQVRVEPIDEADAEADEVEVQAETEAAEGEHNEA